MSTVAPPPEPRYIVNAAGERISVILSLEEYQALLEDLEDLAALAERRDEPVIAHQDLVKGLQDDGLL